MRDIVLSVLGMVVIYICLNIILCLLGKNINKKTTKLLFYHLRMIVTEKQQYIYSIIDAWWNKHGFAPSIQNIMDITGDKSKGNIHRIIIRLCDLGHCKRLPNTARSIRPSYIKLKRPQ